MKNREIVRSIPLLDNSGHIVTPGYAKQNFYQYERGKISANWSRIKEWDFYQVTNQRYTIQITVMDISLAGAWTFACFDMLTGERSEAMSVSPFTKGSMGLLQDGMNPHKISRRAGDFFGEITVIENQRRLRIKKGTRIEADVTLSLLPEQEYLVMAVPFDKPQQFYLNQKMNCMTANGHVRADKMEFDFEPDTAFGVLDWGRGVWPHRCSWYWGNGSTILPDGNIFGFEIGWGFGDMSAATENMLFFNGKAHKINQVFLQKDPVDWMKPWVFLSDDGRFEMTMSPIYDNYTSTRVLEVGNRCHQVFGQWNGTATLDDGTVLEINNMMAFCEFSDNRW